MSFPQILDRLMLEKHVTAYRLEKEIGISNRLIGYYRHGEREPSATNLSKLADFFEVSVDYLLGRTDKPEVNR